MKDIAIYGAGGLGREVACLIGKINKEYDEQKWRIIGFFDDSKPIGTTISDYGDVLGGMEELNNWRSPIDIAVTIGSPKVLKNISESLTNPLIEFPNIISPSTFFYAKESVRMGKGNIIAPQSVISCNVTMGDFNILNVFTQIGHDAVLGNCNILMPSVNISGSVTMGDANMFGVKSTVIQSIKIGSGITLTPGSVLMRKAKDGKMYLGNPAKIFM